MTAKEQTIQRAIELYAIFKRKPFSVKLMKKEAPSFSDYDLRHIRMFNLLDYKRSNSILTFKFNKNPITVAK